MTLIDILTVNFYKCLTHVIFASRTVVALQVFQLICKPNVYKFFHQVARQNRSDFIYIFNFPILQCCACMQPVWICRLSQCIRKLVSFTDLYKPDRVLPLWALFCKVDPVSTLHPGSFNRTDSRYGRFDQEKWSADLVSRTAGGV